MKSEQLDEGTAAENCAESGLLRALLCTGLCGLGERHRVLVLVYLMSPRTWGKCVSPQGLSHSYPSGSGVALSGSSTQL